MSSFDEFSGPALIGPSADGFQNSSAFRKSGERSRERSPGLSGLVSGAEIVVGLIDGLRFSRDCMMQALRSLHSDFTIVPFASVTECLGGAATALDLVLYCSHGDAACEIVVPQHVKELCQTFSSTPVVVLSDARTALQPRHIRNALNSGARGFIPTAITEMAAVVAAIRFVKDGGTFAPLDVLLTQRVSPVEAAGDTQATKHLTPRQMTVLSHLRQGKANKIIAYELGMTESTVKVHIRNIMRKMGATNRTQAVYKSQHLSDSGENAGLSD